MINLTKKFKYRICELNNGDYEVQFKRRFHNNWERYTDFGDCWEAHLFVMKNIREDRNIYSTIIYY